MSVLIKAENCGFQMFNDDEIVTYVQEESDPVDDETDEDEDNNNNESSKGPSNTDEFSALETAMEWYERQSRVLSYSTTAVQENQRPCSEKTKVYDGTHINPHSVAIFSLSREFTWFKGMSNARQDDLDWNLTLTVTEKD
ncbi:UNVERIFIED_CONTAM: hypothetical protein NCL1_39113 [Trichonephila clavipes]